MIGRRSSGKDASKERAEEAPLFNLEEIHERRILSWSPEPEDELASWESEKAKDPPPVKPTPRVESHRPARQERSAPPPALEPRAYEPRGHAPATAATIARAPVTEPIVRDAAPVAAERATTAGGSRGTAAEADRPGTAAQADRPRGRGRPRGRPRRQVHFHVDPDEERLLLDAVAMYGSQQKGLIAALQSLQQVEILREEIEQLRAESAHQSQLLEEAESLFRRTIRQPEQS